MNIKKTEKFHFSFGDFALIFSMIALISIGLISIYSATINQQSPLISNNFQNQIYWFIIGVFLFFITLSLSPKFFQAFAYVIYAVLILCLIAVLFIGKSGGGAERWLTVVGFRFQPSDLRILSSGDTV